MSHRRTDHRAASFIGKLLALALAVAVGSDAWAGDPVAGCAGFMTSDIVVFAEGDPVNEIVGHTTARS